MVRFGIEYETCFITKKKDSEIKMDVPLFVYGSLRKGLTNNYKLDSATYKGVWNTTEMYYMVGMKSGAYPYVVDEKLHDDLMQTHIHADLYLVNKEILESIDRMEGYPTQYNRVYIKITDGKNELHAHMYILVNDDLKNGIRENFDRRFVAVNDGNWLTYKLK